MIPLLLTLAVAAPPTTDAPFIVAIDGSRSVSSTDLAAATTQLAETVDLLPLDLPVGVVVFHDRAEWRVRPTLSRAAVHEALSLIEPEGSVTVLNEALIMASQEMPSGGLVLVVSDGRDEGSAVTAADVERRYSRLDARIFTLSMGRAVDDRALRRLTLLTQGRDLGSLRTSASPVLAASIEEAWQVWRANQPAPLSEPAAPPEIPNTTESGSPSKRAKPVPSWTIAATIGVVATLGLLAIVSAVLRLRSRPTPIRTPNPKCPTCGATMKEWETSCSACEIAALEEAARTRQVDTGHTEIGADGLPMVDPGLTMAVADLGFLVWADEDHPDRRFTLSRGQPFTVGRAPEVNSLQIDDPTVSAQHFKVVPREDQFYIVDLDTTNGTTVNHERIRVRRLSPGDVIRAGLCEFRFELAKGTVN